MNSQKLMAILAVGLLIISFTPAVFVNAQIPSVVGYWKMDQINASDNNRIALDETGVNNAILVPVGN
jgi:hypothetical protein